MKTANKILLYILIAFSASGCGATYINNLRSDNIPSDRPDANDVNYRLYYSINSGTYNKNGYRCKTFLYGISSDHPVTNKDEIQFSNMYMNNIIREEVNKIFNRNKLYLVETFRRNNTDYYLDIDLKINVISVASDKKWFFALSFAYLIPYPFLMGEWDFNLNIDVHNSRPIGSTRPIAKYKYRRIVRHRFSSFLFLLGVIPLLPFDNFGTNADSFKYGLINAMDDMLLEFTRDLKARKLGNIGGKSNVLSEANNRNKIILSVQ